MSDQPEEGCDARNFMQQKHFGTTDLNESSLKRFYDLSSDIEGDWNHLGVEDQVCEVGEKAGVTYVVKIECDGGCIWLEIPN